MLKSQKAAVFIMGLVIGIVAFFGVKALNPTKPDASIAHSENETVAVKAQPRPLASSLGEAPAAEQKPSKKAIRIDQPPALAKLREEVKKDPHETPQALLRFGVDLGVRMQEAKKDKAEAAKLLGELKSCAQPETLDDSPVQARAICLVSARQIEQMWPDLTSMAEEVVSHGDSKALELASKIGGFSR